MTTSLLTMPLTSPLLPIQEIAEKLELSPDRYEPIGMYGAKLKLDLLTDPAFPIRGKLILVTATTPTVSGEGKTLVSIGLAQGLEHIGQTSIVTSREPSLGPIFGLKGGAAGGGLSQVEPSQKINLHFHGDFHAITAAHNLLAALIDAHLFNGNELDLDPAQVTWPRTLDMNDRALRHIAVSIGSKKDGAGRETGFVITAASEIMAILALASSRADLRRRLNAIIVGVSRSGRPVTAADLGATGSMLALLNDAILPNLVQTTEGTPALVHTGPFGNIAHGTSSIFCQQMALRLADYVVNEAGFASDLGAEKYFDIVMRSSGIEPSAAVLVTTVRSLRAQGEGSLQDGFPNLAHHIRNLQRFGVPVVAAINRFPADTPAELEAIALECEEQQVPCSIVEAFAKGGLGAADLAQKVVAAILADPLPAIHPAYSLEDSPAEKIRKIATRVYGASGVTFSDLAQSQLERYAQWGFASLPVCIAKTQYSLSDNPKLLGVPTGWTLHITDVELAAGAGFLVAIAGNMMLMPGLPHTPRALSIDVDDEGNITGV
ncbi:MAG: formate--tetrahydrofolate ligase [Terracidiphilus sp.]|nr:formate--tetrahydrofolate ligase [Terracidiphilus sp.]MDR3776594.1 formate--tetrahydrofolate ligase [Terracidiphilus sp.]